jgi:hypothetical protein
VTIPESTLSIAAKPRCLHHLPNLHLGIGQIHFPRLKLNHARMEDGSGTSLLTIAMVKNRVRRVLIIAFHTTHLNLVDVTTLRITALSHMAVRPELLMVVRDVVVIQHRF